MRSNKSSVEDIARISVRDLDVPDLTRSSSSRFLTTTACHFGHRTWLVCPKCNRRAMSLYPCADSTTVACRICNGLVYESQRHSGKMMRFYRALRNAEKADLLFAGMKRVKFFYRNQLTHRAQRYLRYSKSSI